MIENGARPVETVAWLRDATKLREVGRGVLKVSPRTTGLVTPLGATMNTSGTGLYDGCAVLVIARVFGMEPGFGSHTTLLFPGAMSAVAAAGIPRGWLPLIPGRFAQCGINPGGIAMIAGADRTLDMRRTVVNVGADLMTIKTVDDLTRALDSPSRD